MLSVASPALVLATLLPGLAVGVVGVVVVVVAASVPKGCCSSPSGGVGARSYGPMLFANAASMSRANLVRRHGPYLGQGSERPSYSPRVATLHTHFDGFQILANFGGDCLELSSADACVEVSQHRPCAFEMFVAKAYAAFSIA
eukprot:1027153-Amphidinium_carterae.2